MGHLTSFLEGCAKFARLPTPTRKAVGWGEWLDGPREVSAFDLLPFYSTKTSAAGVGLPLCREIIEAHGGTLRIYGRPGEERSSASASRLVPPRPRAFGAL